MVASVVVELSADGRSNMVTTRFSSLVDTGSVTYCSMNMSFASSRVSARNLVIAS